MFEGDVKFVDDPVGANCAGEEAHVKWRRVRRYEKVFVEAAELGRADAAREGRCKGDVWRFIRGESIDSSGGAAAKEFA
jgi:hypothetical protein